MNSLNIVVVRARCSFAPIGWQQQHILTLSLSLSICPPSSSFVTKVFIVNIHFNICCCRYWHTIFCVQNVDNIEMLSRYVCPCECVWYLRKQLLAIIIFTNVSFILSPLSSSNFHPLQSPLLLLQHLNVAHSSRVTPVCCSSIHYLEYWLIKDATRMCDVNPRNFRRRRGDRIICIIWNSMVSLFYENRFSCIYGSQQKPHTWIVCRWLHTIYICGTIASKTDKNR